MTSLGVLKFERLARRVIHQLGDVVELGLRHLAQIGALGQKLSQQAVGVL
jgi:hypothetical protein